MKTTVLGDQLYRESLVASGLVNKRYIALEVTDEDGPRLASYHKKEDESCTKQFPIKSSTSVSKISRKTFYIREDDQSALGAMLTSQIKENLFYFTINFNENAIFSDKLTLCFKDESTAKSWQEALLKSITSDTSSPSSQMHLLRKGSSESATVMAEIDAQPSLTDTKSSPSSQNHSRHRRSWQSVHHVNGVAVYAEEDDGGGDGGAFMASTVVRVPPRFCFDALMKNSAHHGGELPFSDSTTVLEAIDAHTQVIKLSWCPSQSIYSWICSPREMVSLRTWRKEPDGTYIILYQSANHRKARQTRSGWLPWKSTVRARIEAAGFTISPLLPQYVPGGGASQECLVTLVIKADLAGGLSPHGMMAKIAPMAVDAARWSLLEPLLMSVVMLRDRVEQSRFVVMPYSMAMEDNGSGTHALTGGGVDGDENVEEESTFVITTPTRTPSKRVDSDSDSGLRRRASKAGHLLSSSIKRTATTLTLGRRKSSSLSAQDIDAASLVNGQSNEAQITSSPSPSPPKATTTTTTTIITNNTSAVKDNDDDSKTTTTHDDTMNGGVESIIDPSLLAIWKSKGTCEERFWSYPGSSNLKIRGKTYLEDRIKIPAAPPLFDLYSSDLVDFDEPLWGIAESLPSVQNCTAPFALVLNLIYPHPTSPLQSLVTVWTAPMNPETEELETLIERWGDDEEGTVRAFFTNFKEWIEGEGPEADKRRNTKFKLIPRIVKGSWVVKQGVGTTPVLLGQKLETKYFKGTTPKGCRYFEIDTNITSNSVAHSVTKLVVSSITSLIVDLSVVIEGHREEELPERLIGSVRYEHLDLKTAVGWDDETSTVIPKNLAS